MFRFHSVSRLIVQVCKGEGLDQGRPNILWHRAARGKVTISGVAKGLKYCLMFTLYNNLQIWQRAVEQNVAGRGFEISVLNLLWCPPSNVSRRYQGFFESKADHSRSTVFDIKNPWRPTHSLCIVNKLLGLSENRCLIRGGRGVLSIDQCVVSSPAACPAFCIMKLFTSD